MIKNILFLSESMPFGGTTMFLKNICHGLSISASWKATIGTMRVEQPLAIQARNEGYEVIEPVPESLIHEDRLRDIYRHCQKIHPSVVVATLSSGSFEFLRHVPGNCLRIGIVQSDHVSFYDLIEKYAQWLDVAVGVSEENCRKIALRIGSDTIPIAHIPYGVPMPGYSVKPARTHNHILRVLYLGRLDEEQKRFSILCDTIGKTISANPNMEWIIAGDGPRLNMLKDKFSGNSRVKIMGEVAYKDVPEVIASADVYFLCSDYEGLPLSLLEAMGHGLVPVVSDLPSGIREVVTDSCGIRVPIDSHDRYADELIRLADDPDTITHMSRASIEMVRRDYSIESMATRWASLLANLINAPSPDWTKPCKPKIPLDMEKNWSMRPYFRPIRRLARKIGIRRNRRS